MPTDPADSTSRRRSTYGFLIRPKWIAFHLLVVTLVVVMVNLAFWQLRRLDERRQFNATVQANISQPVAPLDDVRVDIADPSTAEWRTVEVSGTYLPDHQFLVVNRSQNGDTGRNIVDALQINDGSLLLVNRGFVRNADDAPPVPAGPVTIVGRLRASEQRKTGQSADEDVPGLSEIRRIDVGLLTGQFDSTVLPMYVEQLQSTPSDSKVLEPIVAPNTDDEGPHLSYTIQWFIFSGCALGGWILAVRRSAATRAGKPKKKAKSAYIPIADDKSAK